MCCRRSRRKRRERQRVGREASSLRIQLSYHVKRTFVCQHTNHIALIFALLLISRHEELKEELRKCQKALKDMVESKEELETNFYEQFLPILQAKQDKIRELKGMGRMEKTKDEDSYGSSTDIDEKIEEA